MTPISLTCPALTGGAFPAMPTMSHTLTVTPRERHLSAEQGRALAIYLPPQGCLAAQGRRCSAMGSASIC
jgi:hypothetical protein